MIQLRLFGALDIELDDGGDLRTLIAHPKRLALLAYLALRANHRPVPRDSLVAVFWPESDDGRARGALRNALHFLRSRLGRSTVRSQGDRLGLDGVWCDAPAFEDLLERGELEEALELYRGDLLEGFFLPDAPEFEAWLEEERGRLRRRAVDACWSLVDEAEGAGRVALAARYARRALGLAPTDEIGARRLLTLLARSGDVTGALRAHQEFAERLERLYEIEPSPETDRLVSSIRRGALQPDRRASRRPAGAVEAVTAPAATPDRPAPALRPALAAAQPAEGARPAAAPRTMTAGADPARRDGVAAVPGRHTSTARPVRAMLRAPRVRLVGWAAAAMVLVAAATAPRWLPEGAPATPDPAGLATESVLAVLPFDYQGSGALAFLGEGVARLVSDALNGAGDLRTVDRRAVDSFVRLRGPADGAAVALAAARRFGAGYYAVGDVMEQDSTLHITVTLRRESETRDAPGHTATVEGHARDVFALADEVARRLLDGMDLDGIERSAVRAASPLAALKAFLRGEAAARAGWFREAMDEFGQAVREDSTFALAHYGLSAAAYNAGIPDVPRAAADAARRHSASLARSDQLFLEAWANHLDARVPEAETFYRQAIAVQPTHVDGWHQLGELLFHWGPTMGTASEAARRAFEQVLALEPGDASAALHLARIVARHGDRDRVRALAASAGAGATAAWVLEMEALEAFLSDDARLKDATYDAVVAAHDRVGTAILVSVATNTADLDAAAELARELLTPTRGAGERAVARALLVRIEVARGRLSAARAEVDRSPELPEATRRELAAALELLPFLPADASRRTCTATTLADASHDRPLPPQSDPVWMGSSAYPPLRWNGMTREHRLFLLGLCRARAGDLAAARTTAARLEAMALADDAATYPALIRATAELEAGDPAAALAALGPPRRPPGERLESLRDFARPLERWLRAEALAGTGRSLEALRWFATFPGDRGVDLWYAPHARLRRAELHEQMGDAEAARALYATFLEQMRGGESYLREDIERAGDGLRRLRVTP